VVDGETVGTLSDPQADAEAVSRAREALDQACPGPRPFTVGDRSIVLLVFVAPTRVVVVGAVDLAAAIEAQGRLLGWTVVTVETTVQTEAEVAGLRPADAVVVLSHDDAVDAPSLRAALAGRAGFVGALGSRHTQARRADDLRRAGVAEADIGRIHGPVGLDLGGTTPQDTALAICAEILAVRSGRSALTLQGRAAPIH
jgi:xanthine dehydrogenase accessory factor